MKEMTFDEKMRYMEEKYNGIASMSYYKAQGGVKCKTMSWFCYLSCIKELLKIIKEHPGELDKAFLQDFNDVVYTKNETEAKK